MNIDFSLVGWMHTLASVVALIIGALVLFRPKGNELHKRRGKFYVAAMIVTNTTALFIYSLGVFRVFHWMAVGTLLLVLGSHLAAHLHKPARVWPYFHIGGMILSYYMLIGGTINEAFLRLNLLRQLDPDYRALMIGISHSSAMLVFSALLIYMLAMGRRRYVRSQRIGPG